VRLQVVVKTVSGNVASWPATGNVTTRPLPVLDLDQHVVDEETGETAIVWQPNPESYQDQYKVSRKNQDFGGGASLSLTIATRRCCAPQPPKTRLGILPPPLPLPSSPSPLFSALPHWLRVPRYVYPVPAGYNDDDDDEVVASVRGNPAGASGASSPSHTPSMATTRRKKAAGAVDRTHTLPSSHVPSPWPTWP
jgi:hypothetical protein